MKLSDVKPGDKVVIDPDNTWGDHKVVTVTRVTKTRIQAGANSYNKRTGIRIGYGDNWYLQPKIATTWPGKELVTPEEAEQRNEEKKRKRESIQLAKEIKDLSLKSLPPEILRGALKLLKGED